MAPCPTHCSTSRPRHSRGWAGSLRWSPTRWWSLSRSGRYHPKSRDASVAQWVWLTAIAPSACSPA
ncbi:MAG: LPS assembly protein LptD [Mycobacterium sp.]|nr:MAG: LPS assembly protein LptD [Mycobacterium sp.]